MPPIPAGAGRSPAPCGRHTRVAVPVDGAARGPRRGHADADLGPRPALSPGRRPRSSWSSRSPSTRRSTCSRRASPTGISCAPSPSRSASGTTSTWPGTSWRSARWATPSLFLVGSLALILVLGLALALALNEPVRFRTFYRSTVVLPWALTAVVVGVMWRWMLIPDIGIVNYMLAGLGINVSFFLSPAAAMATMILVEVWRSTGYGMILVLAGLQGSSPRSTRPRASTARASGGRCATSRCRSSCRPCSSPRSC